MHAPTAVCCAGWKKGLLLGLALGLPLAGYGVGRWQGEDHAENVASSSTLQWPGGGIDASASDSGEQFSIATGAVGKSAEGLFVLDHESGLLRCSVLYPRAGAFGANFGINVKDVLPGGGKGGSYLLVTGRAEFPGGSNQALGAGAVVYVLDTSTGGFACYAVPYNRVAENAGQPQQNSLVLIGTGQARQVIDRDSLR